MDKYRKLKHTYASGSALATSETVRSATSEGKAASARNDGTEERRVENAAKALPNKVALVCDWLTTPGGAEKVLLELHRLYPDAPIYTSQYSKKGINWFDDATVKTGWLQIFPKSLRKFLGPLRQLYFGHLDLTAYDLVISVTGAEAKSVRARHHLCYCHVPTQYYWQMYDKYLQNPGFGPLNPLVKFFFKLLVKPLRAADYRAAQQPDQFITISTYAQRLIQQYYHRDATIIAPPVEIGKFRRTPRRRPVVLPPTAPARKTTVLSSQPAPTAPLSTTVKPFVISCRQVTWKRVDLAITACVQARQPLLVIGDGPEHRRLVRLATRLLQPLHQRPVVLTDPHAIPDYSALVTFLPWLPALDLARYLQNARAYLFPSLEPFGIAAVEALAAGCPVVAYQEGGSRDFVQPKVNGLLFPQQSASSLERALHDFARQSFDPDTITRTVQRFDQQHFRQQIQKLENSCHF